MSRQINLNDPDSWDEDDKTYLRDRIDMVPAEHRGKLVDPAAPLAPAQEAESLEVARLRDFLMENYPDDMTAAEGESPVGVAIRLLSSEDELVPSEAPDEAEDDYDDWKVAELRAEYDKRGLAGESASMRKQELVDALRANDA